MTQPHHHVFNALQQEIIKGVKIEAVLGHLVTKGVITDTTLYKDKPKNGMKILISYLRNRSFETFLDFVECIFLAQGEAPSKVQSVPVVESMIKAVEDFDERNQSTHAERLVAIQEKYLKQFQEGEQTLEEPRIEAEATTPTAEQQETEIEELPSRLQKLSLLPPLSMPDLDYIQEPVQVSFRSSGGELTDFTQEYGFALTVPPMAVPKGQEVNLRVGLCCYGPFSIAENYFLASDFAVVVADNGFCKPVTVTMNHCLVLPEYKKCSEVIVLKANHQKINDGLYTFDQFTNPVLSPDSAVLTFEIEEFCILCAVLNHGERIITSSSTSSGNSSHVQIDEDNPSSAPSSFDEDLRSLERSFSTESNPPVSQEVFSTSSENGDTASPQKPNLRKRKSDSLGSNTAPSSQRHHRPGAKTKRRSHDSRQDDSNVGKRHCSVEYAAVLLQNREKLIDPWLDEYRFVIFVTTNCPVAHKMCVERAKKHLGPEVDISPIPIAFKKPLKFETAVKSSGWSVETDKTATVTLSEVHFHTMKRKDLFERLNQKTCPPGLLFTAECDEGASKKFSCKVTIRGATTAETQDEVFFNIKAVRSTAPTTFPRQNAIDIYMPPGPHMPPFQHQENVSPNFGVQSLPFYPPPTWSYPADLTQSSGHPGLSQPQFSDSMTQERNFDFPAPHSSQSYRWSGDQDSSQLYRMQMLKSQSRSQDSPVLSQRDMQRLSLGNDSPLLSHQTSHESDFLGSSSLTRFGELLLSDVERDRANSLPTYPRITYYENLLTSEEKNLSITNIEYSMKIIQHMRDWKKVARHGFNFTEAKVEQLDHDHKTKGFKECAYQAYLMWKMENGHTGPISVWTILQILYNADQFEAIDYFVKDIKGDATENMSQ